MKNPLSLDGLISWLEQQEPSTEYNFIDNEDCLVCRYFRAVGLPIQSAGPWTWRDGDGNDHPLLSELNDVANNYLSGNPISTYGQALAFARWLKAEPHP